MSEPLNWELLLDAAKAIAARSMEPFSRIDVYRKVWESYPDRQRGTLDPIFQGMISNAPGGPASAVGMPFRRVSRGLYVLEPTRSSKRS